jgi:methyl-accepting chemotaxis protein
MELRKGLPVPAPRPAEVVMLNVARLERSGAPGNRPWESFFAWTFGASTIVVLSVFVLAAFYPGLMASWLGIGALAALVGLLAIATWLTARPVMALSNAAADFQSGDLRARAIPSGGVAKLTDGALATSGEAVLAIERRGEQLNLWMRMTEALAEASGKVVPAVQQQTNSSGGVSLAIQLIADTSRSLAAATEATIASDLAPRRWAQERVG